jgi:hypothetical protein
MDKRPHYDLIVAWAEGNIIQERNWEGEWQDNPAPKFDLYGEYRLKPEPKPDIVKKFLVCLDRNNTVITSSLAAVGYNLILTFDGETRQLVSAEVSPYV